MPGSEDTRSPSHQTRNTYHWYDTGRPTFDATLSATHCKSAFLGVNHEVKPDVSKFAGVTQQDLGLGTTFSERQTNVLVSLGVRYKFGGS